MAIRYNHRRVDPAEFSRLLDLAEFSVDDFLYLTGRRRDQLEHFLKGTRKDYIPTMAEVLILELAAICRGHPLVDELFNIAARYDAGPRQKGDHHG